MTPKKQLLIAFTTLFVTAGLFAPQLPNLGRSPDSLLLAQALGSSAIVLWWCRADVRARGVKSGAPRFAALLPPIGLPYHFFKTRTPGRAFKAVGKAFLFYIGVDVLYAVATIVSGTLS